MKVYIHFNQNDQAYVCHNMAVYWKKKFDWKSFAGITLAKDNPHLSFLRNQKQINYEFIDVIDELEYQALNYEVSDSELIKWERRFDKPLWQLIIADRNIGYPFVKGGKLIKTDIMKLANHENMTRFALFFLEFYGKKLSDFSPDFVFLPANASLHSLALTWVCEFLKIPYYLPVSTRINDNFVVADNNVIGQSSKLQSLLSESKSFENSKLSNEFQKYYESFETEDSSKPEWFYDVYKGIHAIEQESFFRFNFYTVKVIISTLIKSLRKKKKYLRRKDLISHAINDIERRYIIRYFSEKYFDNNLPQGEKFILFPLHLNPEASTMVLAPNFVDQEFVIDLLAKNIPLTHKLYVKEHHAMVGKRPKSFYKKIKENPNVRLINPFVNSHDLIKKSDLVATITSTVGWEVIMMHKPVILFGDCFYSRLGFAESCSDIEELSKKIKSLVFEKKKCSKKKLVSTLSCIEKSSFSIPPNLMWGMVKRNEDALNQVNAPAIANLCENIYKTHLAAISEN